MSSEAQRWADGYADIILSGMPDALNDTTLIRIIGSLITAYKPDQAAAMELMTVIMALTENYYAAAETGGECMCADCVAHRKENSH